jgi:hypothetical protein
MRSLKMRHPLRTVLDAPLVACLFIGVGFGAFAGIRSEQYMHHDKRPNSARGWTEPLPIKSIVVFVTPEEKSDYEFDLRWFTILLGGTGALLLARAVLPRTKPTGQDGAPRA